VIGFHASRSSPRGWFPAVLSRWFVTGIPMYTKGNRWVRQYGSIPEKLWVKTGHPVFALLIPKEEGVYA